MILLKKYFKNVWTLEWKNDVPILKKFTNHVSAT